MTNEIHVHKLTGCSPIPLASYLKALGILRLVAEQADPTAQGWWLGDVFHLRTKLNQHGLREFFVNKYRPTPLVAPWNGGSGFYPKDNQSAITALCEGHTERTVQYRETISACRLVLTALGLKEKPDGEAKGRLLIACRGRLPDEAVVSLDAAYVLTDDGPKYPPLLGTGFNDGRLEFTNNFMQRLLDLIEPQSGNPTTSAMSWWEEAFFPRVQGDLQKDSILGQFDPGAVERPVNPWDYVLMLEGALVFAAAAVKRHESATKGALSYPFCVRSAGIGYGSSASSDEGSCRAELWLPLWLRPCTYPELQTLLSEGRVQVEGRSARNGVDFARAVSTLGTDRGIDQFVRFGFHARNGLAYFAVPLGRFKVEPQPQVNLLAEIDGWLDSFRRAVSSDNAPSRAQRALRRLESAILELCQQKGPARLQAVLVALGEAQAALVVSSKWRAEAFQRPVPLLSPKWFIDCDDATSEFRLAASLAAMFSSSVGDFRQHLEPVEVKGRLAEGRSRWVEWTEDSSAACNVVWNAGDLEDNLIAVLKRRIVEAVRHGERSDDGTLVFPGQSLCSASRGDVGAFLRHDTDDDRIASLVRGLVLLDWGRVQQSLAHKELQRGPADPMPDATFSLLKLCHTPWAVRDVSVRLEPTIARLAAAGRADAAMKHAARRLIGSGLSPAIRVASRDTASTQRMAAALLFPLSWADVNTLANSVLKAQSAAVEVVRTI
ncbi:MAG: type I-U CRISPR-associated protein Csx17 [Planctomycetales bacterium]|nr:type I-U CRISPR-associated protein Csx17 [Planctomycetales bacterium]